MKKLFIAVLLLTAGMLNAQEQNYPSKGTRVEVINWGSLSIWLGNDFFQETKDSIIAQIGEEEFEWMQKHGSSAGWPRGLYQSSLDEAEDHNNEERLNRLKKYRVAVFRHIYHGKLFERYAILRVPYEENKNWDKNISWDKSIYFLVRESDVVEVKESLH